MAHPHKPTFLSSVAAGIGGYAKGFLAGGVAGILIGAVIGAAIGVATGGLVPAVIAASTVNGAIAAGWSLALVGALAGTMTGVVKHREAAQPSAADIINVAKLSYAQGVGVGHHLAQAEEQTTFRDRITKERATQQTAQRIH